MNKKDKYIFSLFFNVVMKWMMMDISNSITKFSSAGDTSVYTELAEEVNKVANELRDWTKVE